MEQKLDQGFLSDDSGLRFNLSITFVDDNKTMAPLVVPEPAEITSNTQKQLQDDNVQATASKVSTSADQQQQSPQKAESKVEGMTVDAFLQHLQTTAAEVENKLEADGVNPQANQVIASTVDILGAHKDAAQEHQINGSLFLEGRQLHKFIQMAMQWVKNEALPSGAKINLNIGVQNSAETAAKTSEGEEEPAEQRTNLKRKMRDDFLEAASPKRTRREMAYAQSQLDFYPSVQHTQSFNHNGSCWNRSANHLISGPTCYREMLPAHSTAKAQVQHHHNHQHQQAADHHNRKSHSASKHANELHDADALFEAETPEAWPFVSNNFNRFSCAYFRR